MFVPIQAIDISLTLPMSHNKYDEWLDKDGIGIHGLKWSPQPVFESWVGTNVARSMSGLIQAFHSSLTLPTSHYKYNEYLY